MRRIWRVPRPEYVKEQRRGVIQKLIKFISEILVKLSRWLQPRRR